MAYKIPNVPLGEGSRFEKLKGTLKGRGARTPGALAAWIGRKKWGKTRFQKLAAKGRHEKATAKNKAIAKVIMKSK